MTFENNEEDFVLQCGVVFASHGTLKDGIMKAVNNAIASFRQLNCGVVKRLTFSQYDRLSRTIVY